LANASIVARWRLSLSLSRPTLAAELVRKYATASTRLRLGKAAEKE
jgi:hypothetical protein